MTFAYSGLDLVCFEYISVKSEIYNCRFFVLFTASLLTTVFPNYLNEPLTMRMVSSIADSASSESSRNLPAINIVFKTALQGWETTLNLPWDTLGQRKPRVLQ